MRIRDWSSDVCSSDLGTQADLSGVGKSRARDAGDRGVQIAVGEDDAGVLAAEFERHRAYAGGGRLHDRGAGAPLAGKGDCIDVRMTGEVLAALGRASCWERVCQYVLISVVAGFLSKKN